MKIIVPLITIVVVAIIGILHIDDEFKSASIESYVLPIFGLVTVMWIFSRSKLFRIADLVEINADHLRVSRGEISEEVAWGDIVKLDTKMVLGSRALVLILTRDSDLGSEIIFLPNEEPGLGYLEPGTVKKLLQEHIIV